MAANGFRFVQRSALPQSKWLFLVCFVFYMFAPGLPTLLWNTVIGLIFASATMALIDVAINFRRYSLLKVAWPVLGIIKGLLCSNSSRNSNDDDSDSDDDDEDSDEHGNASSRAPSNRRRARPVAAASTKRLTVQDVQMTLRAAGLEKSKLVLGIDCTKSNTWTGMKSFNGRSLHALAKDVMNPYQMVIKSIGATLAPFDDDGRIPVYGFGDSVTHHHSVFHFNDEGKDPVGFEQVLDLYTHRMPTVVLDGNTSFAPLIRKAIEIVRSSGNVFTILVIVTDGAVTETIDTAKAIVEASHYPLAILAVGVGDGPWDEMHEFDNELPERAFDNFTFVNYTELMRTRDATDMAFVSEALRELPDQYKYVRKHNMIGRVNDATRMGNGSTRRRRRDD